MMPNIARPAKTCIAVKSMVNSKPITMNGVTATTGFPPTGSTQSEAVQAGNPRPIVQPRIANANPIHGTRVNRGPRT